VFDPIHLDADGYRYKIANQTLSYFLPRWRGTPQVTFFAEGNGRDGWSDGSSSSSTVIQIGDNGTTPIAGLLSFDTAGIPDDALVTGAALYLIRADGLGSNSFASGTLTPTVDIASGYFGTEPAVETADFNAPATVSNAGCVYGTVTNNEDALRVDIAATGFTAINVSGTTQFRVTFNTADSGANTVSFHTGDNTAVPDPLAVPGLAHATGRFVPVLDVDYCQAATAVSDLVPQPSGNDIQLNWSLSDRATSYELWRDNTDLYFAPTGECLAAPNCTVVTTLSANWLDALNDSYAAYLVRPVNETCALATAVSNRAGHFQFAIQPAP
jgi:hypothetical protein